MATKAPAFSRSEIWGDWHSAEKWARQYASQTNRRMGLWELADGRGVGVKTLYPGTTYRPAPAMVIDGRIRKNPAARRDVEQAADLFEDFTGDPVQTADVAEVRALPKVAAVIGKIRAVEYDTIRDGEPETYRHEFKEHARPLFAVAPDGRSLHMLGGAFQFTERGIVDKPRPRKSR